jgi:hypothetical protein
MDKGLGNDGEPLNPDKLTLQAILQRGYAVYERGHPLPD